MCVYTAVESQVEMRCVSQFDDIVGERVQLEYHICPTQMQVSEGGLNQDIISAPRKKGNSPNDVNFTYEYGQRICDLSIFDILVYFIMKIRRKCNLK